MNRNASEINWGVVLAFAAVYLIWGTTYLAIRIGVEVMPPFIMASMRYFIAGALLLIFVKIKGDIVFDKTIVGNLLLGSFMQTCGQGVIFWAEKYVPSGLTAVLISTAPIWYIVIDRKNWKSYFNSKLTLFSIILGLIGVVVLFKNQTIANNHVPAGLKITATLVIMGACLCWVAASLYYKYNNQPGSLYKNVGWQMLGGFIACFVISAIAGEWKQVDFATLPLRAWGAVLYLAIAGSIVAFTAMFWLLQRRPAPIVGTYAYVNPVIAVLLGWLVANESINTIQIAGMVIILVAAYLANLVKFSTSEIK